MELTCDAFSQDLNAQDIRTPDMSLALRRVVDGIADHGYAIIHDFLSADDIAQLAAEARLLQQSGEMRRAAIGKTNGQADDKIRGDIIHWLEESDSKAQQLYLQQMEALRKELNQQLYLNLHGLESHFAIYPPGTFYRRHLDQFQGNTERQVSCVLYLNADWRMEYGGQLRIYLDGTADTPHLDIEPTGGTLVVFLSGRFPHEVLPATEERLSITGWFRTRSQVPL